MTKLLKIERLPILQKNGNKLEKIRLIISFYYIINFMNFAVIGLGGFGIKRAAAIKKSNKANLVAILECYK